VSPDSTYKEPQVCAKYVLLPSSECCGSYHRIFGSVMIAAPHNILQDFVIASQCGATRILESAITMTAT